MPGSAVIGNLAVNLSLETAAFTAGATAAQSSMRGLTTEAQNMARGVRSFSLSAGNARIVGLELAHVTRAISEQLAMGVSPARAFASEIGRISTAVQYAGGVSGLARAIAGLVAPFAAAAAGAGLLATAFLGIKQAADGNDLKAYISTLGLTEQEIEKLKNTTVTWGDVTTATLQVMAEKAGTSAGAISSAFSSAFQSIGEFGKFAASVLLAAFGAAVKGVADVVIGLPSIVGGAVTAAANLATAALEKMVNLGIAGLNKLSGTINGVLGTSFGQVAEVSLGRVQDTFTGTMRAIGADVSGTFHDIFNRTEATFGQISARAVQLRKNDLAAQAAALRSSDAAGRAAKGHTERAKAVKEEANELDKLTKNLDALLAKEVKVDAELLNVKPLAEIKLPEIPQIPEKIRSPWQEWADSIPQTAEAITAAFQGIAVHGLDSISAAIGDVITGARSLKDAFGDIARSIISNLIEMSTKMLIFRALSSVFGGLSFDSAGFNNIVASNSAELGVAMPGMASGGRGTFGGLSGVDKNVLSLNGSPFARVSKGEQFSVSPANSNGQGYVINQTIAPNFAGNAATREDLQRMAIITKSATIQAIEEKRRRA